MGLTLLGMEATPFCRHNFRRYMLAALLSTAMIFCNGCIQAHSSKYELDTRRGCVSRLTTYCESLLPKATEAKLCYVCLCMPRGRSRCVMAGCMNHRKGRIQSMCLIHQYEDCQLAGCQGCKSSDRQKAGPPGYLANHHPARVCVCQITSRHWFLETWPHCLIRLSLMRQLASINWCDLTRLYAIQEARQVGIWSRAAALHTTTTALLHPGRHTAARNSRSLAKLTV